MSQKKIGPPGSAMLRSTARVAGSYRVLFSPDAWKRVGLLPSSTFQSLHVALDGLAGNLGGRRPPGEDAQSELHAQAAGLLILYQRDDETRTLTLVDFLPATPEHHAPAERGRPGAAPLEPRKR